MLDTCRLAGLLVPAPSPRQGGGPCWWSCRSWSSGIKRCSRSCRTIGDVRRHQEEGDLYLHRGCDECDQLERPRVGDASGRLMCLRRLAYPRRCESAPVVITGARRQLADALEPM